MRRSLALGLALVVPCLFIGCDPGKPTSGSASSHSHDGHSHDGHSHGDEGAKLDLKDSVAKVVELAGKIKEAGEKGDFDSAHDEVHDIGHLLEGLAAKAKAESKSDEEQAAIKAAADALFATIGKIDEGLHDNKEVKFDDIKEAFEAELAALKALWEKL